ncbi:sigma 54-interacting transcriptional regulator [Desulfofundulus thermocisternus]|uniref:sigma 54-interacting transcriptional regulator n=1 Tax=Desulfofundulus thermocisternus TaxID=42471 RepID=UPI00217CF9C8|nr:sigma 54-interacting transcriptional regulator [Desulfofundulus thermocisternus]
MGGSGPAAFERLLFFLIAVGWIEIFAGRNICTNNFFLLEPLQYCIYGNAFLKVSRKNIESIPLRWFPEIKGCFKEGGGKLRLRDIMNPFSLVLSKETGIKQAIEQWWSARQPEIVAVVDEFGSFSNLLTWREFSCVERMMQERKEQTKDSPAVGTVELLFSMTPPALFLAVSAEIRLEEIHAPAADWLVALDEDGYPIGFASSKVWLLASLEYLQNRELMFKSILEGIHSGVVATDSRGIVVWFNNAAEKCLNYPKEVIVGKHIAEFPALWDLGLLDVARSGASRPVQKLFLNYLNPPRVLLTHVDPVMRNGTIEGAVAIFQDVSELEAVSGELETVRQLNQQLESFLNASSDGILVTDRAGNVLRVNRALLDLMANAGLPGKWADSEDTPERILQIKKHAIYPESLLQDIIVNGEKKSKVIELGEEKKRQILITGNPVFDGGELSAVLFNYRDLTQFNELRYQLEITKATSERYGMELEKLRYHLGEKTGFIIASPVMQNILDVVFRVAQVDSTVLLLGESGVGKDCIANLIHAYSQRKDGPFIKINCGAIPESLLESELFGYEPGAFSGASREGKPGLFELAENGTLLLDEVGDLPLPLQVKLLRALQDKNITRIGGVKSKTINVRIIAATNQDLAVKVKEGLFRKDLYFRLNVVPINIPPLRERKEEIIPLVREFTRRVNEKYKLAKSFAPEVLDVFVRYNWPGNVRELENVIERLIVTSPGEIIGKEQVPSFLLEDEDLTPGVSVRGIMPLKAAVRELERQLIEEAIARFGSICQAARALGVDQSTLNRKRKRGRMFRA